MNLTYGTDTSGTGADIILMMLILSSPERCWTAVAASSVFRFIFLPFSFNLLEYSCQCIHSCSLIDDCLYFDDRAKDNSFFPSSAA